MPTDCVACGKTTDGAIQIALEIRFPLTGLANRGVAHLDCAIRILQEVKAMALNKVDVESKPS